MSPGTIVLAILALGFLIVVHEAGHYFVARWCKMRVERFSIGFGPGILKRKNKHGTIFQIAPIPFGGFVEIRGMNIAEDVDPNDKEAYPNRPAWQRFLTILAGPATNYISAIFLVFGLYTCHGVETGTWYVESVKDGYDAKGKIEVGDRIVAINGERMFAPSPSKLIAVINKHANGKPVAIDVTVLRGSESAMRELTVKINTKVAIDEKGELVKIDDKQQYFIGVGETPDIVPLDVGEAIAASLEYPIEQTKNTYAGLRDIFTGDQRPDPGGPVRIVKEFDAAFSHSFARGIKLLAMLSVYLGLFNLFPLPALDGGRLVFLGYEMVTRRRANPKIETMVHMGGIMVLMVVMILVTLNDCNVF